MKEVASTSTILPSSSYPAPVASWWISCDQLTKEEMTQACILESSTGYSGTTWKWMAIAPWPIPKMSLKDRGEGKPSQWSVVWAVHLVANFSGKEKWPDEWLFRFISCSRWLGWKGRDLEGAWFENWCQRNLGKRSLWMSKTREDAWSPCGCFPKADLSKERL